MTKTPQEKPERGSAASSQTALRQAGMGTLLQATTCAVAFGQESATITQSVSTSGVSGVWVLANVSYAGMRAQGNERRGWRIASFIFGFPGTLLSFLAVEEGGCRAYGVDLPRRRN